MVHTVDWCVGMCTQSIRKHSCPYTYKFLLLTNIHWLKMENNQIITQISGYLVHNDICSNCRCLVHNETDMFYNWGYPLWNLVGNTLFIFITFFSFFLDLTDSCLKANTSVYFIKETNLFGIYSLAKDCACLVYCVHSERNVIVWYSLSDTLFKRL